MGRRETTQQQSVTGWVYRLWVRLLPIQLILIMSMIGLVAGVMGALTISLLRGDIASAPLPPGAEIPPTPIPMGQVYTAEVQHWRPKIEQWAQKFDIDPNILATVMQIESCGDPYAGSNMGAMGLFQLIHDHFQPGEDPYDPDTNALRGSEYLKEGLVLADGHVGLALAGYNGGHGVIDGGWGSWYPETRLYYTWGTQIYLDAIRGKTTAQSAALQDWLNSGGVNLCRQAANRIAGTLTPQVTPSP